MVLTRMELEHYLNCYEVFNRENPDDFNAQEAEYEEQLSKFHDCTNVDDKQDQVVQLEGQLENLNCELYDVSEIAATLTSKHEELINDKSNLKGYVMSYLFYKKQKDELLESLTSRMEFYKCKISEFVDEIKALDEKVKTMPSNDNLRRDVDRLRDEVACATDVRRSGMETFCKLEREKAVAIDANENYCNEFNKTLAEIKLKLDIAEELPTLSIFSNQTNVSFFVKRFFRSVKRLEKRVEDGMKLLQAEAAKERSAVNPLLAEKGRFARIRERVITEKDKQAKKFTNQSQNLDEVLTLAKAELTDLSAREKPDFENKEAQLRQVQMQLKQLKESEDFAFDGPHLIQLSVQALKRRYEEQINIGTQICQQYCQCVDKIISEIETNNVQIKTVCDFLPKLRQ